MLVPFPSSALPRLKFVSIAEVSARLTFPVAAVALRAGFPSPAADFEEDRLDLNDLIEHKEATFFAWCEGDSMIGLGLRDGDLLVIDKAVEPELGDIVVAEIAGEFTVKRLGLHAGEPHLLPANPAYPTIKIPPEGLCCWGVVIRVIHNPRPRAKRRKL